MNLLLSALPLLVLLALCYALSRQARRPRGWLGRHVIGNALNQGNRRLLEAAVSALAPEQGEEIADIGFGGGLSLDLIRDRVAPARPIGVEISDEMIEAGRARWGEAVVLHKADVAALPFPDASLDGILSVNTIYFWADLPAACREIRRALKPGGRVVFGFRRPAMMRLSPITWFGFRLRPAHRVEQCLRDASFLPLVHDMPKGEVLIVGRAQHAEGIGDQGSGSDTAVPA